MKSHLIASLIILLLFPGCRTVMSPTDTVSMGQSVVKAARPITDEEEYYIGRAVAARILATYPLQKNDSLTAYVNQVGQSVTLNSERPQTFNGYHFALLKTTEINAFACPGGIIFITTGMLNITRNEDELASVLAHEVAHVSARDGISAIKQSRWTEAATLIASKTAAQYAPGDLSKLVSLFEGSIDDVFKALVTSGYSQSQEYAADEKAIAYLSKSGYDPKALQDLLGHLAVQQKGSGVGVFKTHPDTAARTEKVRRNTPATRGDEAAFKKRLRRFQETVRQRS